MIRDGLVSDIVWVFVDLVCFFVDVVWAFADLLRVFAYFAWMFVDVGLFFFCFLILDCFFCGFWIDVY